MQTNLTRSTLLLAALLSAPAAHALEATFYGSARLQAEVVDPDNLPGSFAGYTDLRDAYSRLGLKASHALDDTWSALFQVEIPADPANADFQYAYNKREELRIFKLQVAGPLGTAWYGRGWLAYYNFIAYPLDYFSSYYSGFATFTTFRLSRTLYYASPSWHGLSFAASSSDENGKGNAANRNQFAVGYARGGLTLAAGVDDLDPSGIDQKILGVSATYTRGPWYVAAKYEWFDSDVGGSGYGSDGSAAANLLVQREFGDRHTLRAMLADVDDFGETVVHVGYDFQYDDALKLFAEYYHEETTAALADARKSTFGGPARHNAPADDGGSAFVVGLRYDFGFGT